MPPAEELLGIQNSDGGWGYAPPSGQRGASWTEPTCYALLALSAAGQEGSPGAIGGSEWLAKRQRIDGGFAPRESVQESTWLTALTLLLPARLSGAYDRGKAEAWLVQQSGRESGWLFRARNFLADGRAGDANSYDGWPWYPGAAAWVTPTAMSILALENVARGGARSKNSAERLQERIRQGRTFLLTRRCRDGGWNHGSTQALGYDADSYPETTGVALLALRGTTDASIADGVHRAEQHLANCKSREAAAWLTLGLLAHGKAAASVTPAPHGGTLELAITSLADAAREGRGVFFP